MTVFDAVRYRLYFALRRAGPAAIARRWPATGRTLAAVKRRILPDRDAWVQVQSGLSRGMWMHLHLPDDARYWRGEHESGLEKAITAVIGHGDVVYDIGCHLGYVSLGLARLVGDLGRVVAFDGDPDNIARMRDNIARNHLADRLQALHAVAWSYSAPAGIPFRRGGAQGGVEADGIAPPLGRGELVPIPAMTLDDFLSAGGPPPQLIKIDVEGGEYEVLRGGESLFTTQRPLLIVEVHGAQAERQISGWLEEHRYRARWKIPEEGFPRHLFAWPAEREIAAWQGGGIL